MPPVALTAPRLTVSSYRQQYVGSPSKEGTFTFSSSFRTVSKSYLEEETYRLGKTNEKSYQYARRFQAMSVEPDHVFRYNSSLT